MIITKKKKGAKDYFYLKHSFRKNGKTVTKEKYLGAKVPKNINEIILNFRKQLNDDLNNKLKNHPFYS